MKKIALFLLSCFFLSACSLLPSSWTSANKAHLPTLKKGEAGVVFVRESGKIAGPVVNIYLDESYFTSLPEGQYKTATVCAENQRISTQFSGTPIEDKYGRTQNWKLPAGEWTYLTLVLGEDNQPAFAALDKKEGREWLVKNHKQDYTLPRNKNLGCNVITPLKPITVEAQAMFKTGLYQYNSISPKGREKIAQIAKGIANKPEIILVNVVGHTDPEGNTQANQVLSKRRAQAIKEGLIRGGVDKALITVEGLGDTQLKVSDCAQKHPKDMQARKNCNRPNRRVEIQIHGLNP